MFIAKRGARDGDHALVVAEQDVADRGDEGKEVRCKGWSLLSAGPAVQAQKLITVLRPRTRMLTFWEIAPGRYTYWMFGRMVRPGTGTKPY
jgi:hypothetical protein